MPYLDRIINHLWSAADGQAAPNIWAILDGARDKRIYRSVRFSARDFCCLYSGRLAPELQEVAPYLVHLGKDSQFTRELIAEGWGNSWGIFLAADAALDQLRRHLRGFLRVQDEQGTRLVFRYYDPRVLRVYLPTCTPQELRQFFGPIKYYVAEGEDADMMIWYGRTDEGLDCKSIDLANSP